MEKFLEEMADILETEEELKPEMKLEELENWDSLAFVNYLALAVSAYKKKVDRKAAVMAETLGDLYALLQ